jgi:hypothetical protein
VNPTRRAARAWVALAVVVFLAHGINYLYFFVDDEAIPLVFARHLLEGKGFVYNSFEGRVEGYSDFLHILCSAIYTLCARGLGLSPESVIFIGKAVSLASAATAVGLVAAALFRRPLIDPPGMVVGTAFLVLAPSLARWSASSLEMAPVALLATVLTLSVLDGTAGRDRWTAIASCLLVLLRIDGVVFVAALLAPAWLFADRPRRRELMHRVAIPLGVTLTAYHAWRIWYFGHWLPAPLVAKVLYRFLAVPHAVTRAAEQPYLLAFIGTYGSIAAVVALGLIILAAGRDRRTWPLLASVAILIAYASSVGDWMSGFRFFLPALPAIAILLAFGISAIASARVARVTAVVTVLWLSGSAVRAATTYDVLDYRESWWVRPSIESWRYFGPYLKLYEALRPMVPPGTRIAYNQAGFIPYMLDADNVDDLGICSRFVADLPTTDVVFTGVGRYSPLTNGPALRAANAYVLYLAPELVIAQRENLRAANRGEIPQRILRDHYAQLPDPAVGPAAVYRKIKDSAAEYHATPHVFLENFAHPTHLVSAVESVPVPADEIRQRLPFLADGLDDRSFTGQWRLELTFSMADEPVYEVTLHRIWSRTEVALELTLRDVNGAIVRQHTQPLRADRSAGVRLAWPEGVLASRLSLTVRAMDASPARVTLRDLRVQGQSAALQSYVTQWLFWHPIAGRRNHL